MLQISVCTSFAILSWLVQRCCPLSPAVLWSCCLVGKMSVFCYTITLLVCLSVLSQVKNRSNLEFATPIVGSCASQACAVPACLITLRQLNFSSWRLKTCYSVFSVRCNEEGQLLYLYFILETLRRVIFCYTLLVSTALLSFIACSSVVLLLSGEDECLLLYYYSPG